MIININETCSNSISSLTHSKTQKTSHRKPNLIDDGGQRARLVSYGHTLRYPFRGPDGGDRSVATFFAPHRLTATNPKQKKLNRKKTQLQTMIINGGLR